MKASTFLLIWLLLCALCSLAAAVMSTTLTL